jgi:hypothetical protein
MKRAGDSDAPPDCHSPRKPQSSRLAGHHLSSIGGGIECA